MWNIRRVFALSAFLAAFVLGPPARGQQEAAEFNLGPGGFSLGQEGGGGFPIPNDGLGMFPSTLMAGSALGPDAPGHLLMLIHLPAVQQELKLTDSQKLKLKELKETQTHPGMGGVDQAGGNEPAPARENAQPGPKSSAGKRSATPATRKTRSRGQGLTRQQPQGDGDPGNNNDPTQGGFGPGQEGGGIGPGGTFGQGSGFDPMALIAQIVPRLRQSETEMLKILEPKQRERLEEIGLQHEGIRAVARPEIGRKVNLSTAQANQVRGIATQLQASQWEMMGQHRDAFLEQIGPASPTQVDPRIIQEAIKQAGQANQGLEKRAEAMINRLLKPAQKEAFQKLQGEPFDLKSALAGKPLRRTPGDGDRAEGNTRGRRSNDGSEEAGDEARTPTPTAEKPRSEAPRPANKLQVPRAKDAGKRPSAVKRP